MNDTPPKAPHGTPVPPAAADVPAVETLRPVAYLELKAAALLLFTLALIVGSGLYLLYARGAFEPTQTLILTADDSEGVVVGMDMTFSGFPIGRVRRIELADSGNARILVDVPRKDAHWLRASSVFTLVRGLVGGTNIRAYSGILTDDPLPDGAVRPVLRGDATAEIPQLMATARELLANLNALTSPDAALGSSLANVKTLTDRLNGPGGALGVLMGNEADAKKIIATLERTNTLLARLDGMAARADRQVLGSDVAIAVQALDETNRHIVPERLIADLRACGQRALVATAVSDPAGGDHAAGDPPVCGFRRRNPGRRSVRFCGQPATVCAALGRA